MLNVVHEPDVAIDVDDDRWVGPPLDGGRLMVVAPHPDDEVLQAGGLIRWWVASGRPVTVVAVTDGEASHPWSTRTDAEQLRARRAAERTAALAQLVASRVAVVRLGQPDRACGARRPAIAGALCELVRPGDVVVGPAIEDRHPDHVAVALAVRSAAAAPVASLWEAPTWALVHGVAAFPSAVLRMGRATWRAKRCAVREYRSQLSALGPDAADGPVVRPDEVAAMVRPLERFRRVTR